MIRPLGANNEPQNSTAASSGGNMEAERSTVRVTGGTERGGRKEKFLFFGGFRLFCVWARKMGRAALLSASQKVRFVVFFFVF